jgi:hypothetical protein
VEGFEDKEGAVGVPVEEHHAHTHFHAPHMLSARAVRNHWLCEATRGTLGT